MLRKSTYLKRLKNISNTLRSALKNKWKGNDSIVIENTEKKNDITVLKVIDKREHELDDIVLPITEKERDATVRSRLSKECGKLKEKKFFLDSTGLNITLIRNDSKEINWEDYQFDRTVKNLQAQTLSPIITNNVGDKTGSQSIMSSNRPIRGEPGKVLFAFVPNEWFTFFVPKTGYTGFGTFIFTLTTYLVSKEIYVLEHNFYNGLSVAVLVWATIKYIGPHVASYLDQEVDEYEESWWKERRKHKDILNEEIDDELKLQYQCEGQTMLIQVKRENVALQLEDEFRKRQMFVYKEILDRLNYHVAVEAIKRKYQQKNLVDYVQREVLKAITPEMHRRLIDFSTNNILSELNKLNEKK